MFFVRFMRYSVHDNDQNKQIIHRNMKWLLCKPLIDIFEPDSNSKSSWLPSNVKLKFLSPNK